MAQPDAMDVSDDGYETDDTIDAVNPDEDGERRLDEYFAREAAAAEQRRQAPSTPPPTNMTFNTPLTEVVSDPTRSRGLSDNIQPLDLFGAKNDDDDDDASKPKGAKGGASKSRRRRRSKRRRTKKSLRKRRSSRKRKTNKRRKPRSF